MFTIPLIVSIPPVLIGPSCYVTCLYQLVAIVLQPSRLLLFELVLKFLNNYRTLGCLLERF